MKRLLILAAVVLLPSLASAQPVGPFPPGVTPPVFGLPIVIDGGGTIPIPILAPQSCTVPAYSFTGATTSGYGFASSTACVVIGGTQRLGVSATNATLATTNTATSGSTSSLSILPTYNQASGNAANTDLLVNRTETLVGSGAQRLIDAQVAGVTKFNVNTGGTISNTGNISMNGAGALIEMVGSSTGNTSSGAASLYSLKTKVIASIANNVATDVFTVTVPNASNMATIRVMLSGSLGAGGAIGAGEATGNISYDFAVTRTAGVATVATASTAYGSSTAAVAGAATITITVAASAMSGLTSATQTFTIQVTIARGSGSSTNHTCRATAEIINANASGITVQ